MDKIERSIKTMDAFVKNHNTSLEVEAWQILRDFIHNQKEDFIPCTVHSALLGKLCAVKGETCTTQCSIRSTR